MFVQVRMFDSDTSERIDVSLCESIAKLKEKVADKLNAGVDLAPDAIRLFFDGKEESILYFTCVCCVSLRVACAM